MTEENKITIDDKEYDLSSFTVEQKTYTAQLRDINIQQDSLRMRFDQLEAAKSVFVSKLKSSLES